MKGGKTILKELYCVLDMNTKAEYFALESNYQKVISTLDKGFKQQNLPPRQRKLKLFVVKGKTKELICSYVWKKNKLVEKY
jgi:hypothetical protein